MEQLVEKHPFEPWLPEDARLLMCGTFPPAPARWSMDFYYPNYINDMWRVFGLLTHGDRLYFVDEEHKTFRLAAIKEMLTDLGIALSDTGREAVRLKGNASDKYLHIEKPIDLPAMMTRIPACEAIATTGEKAAQVIAGLTGTPVPKTGEWEAIRVPGVPHVLTHWRMPSTSRAFPMPVEKKAEFYRCMLHSLEIL